MAGAATDRQLVSACLDGDDMAWGQLVDGYGPLVYSVIRRYPLAEVDAVDTFEQVWAELWDELERLRGRNRLGPWLIAVAGRLAFGASKRRAPGGERRPADALVADYHSISTPRRRSAV